MRILEATSYLDFGKIQLNNMKKTLILVVFVFVGAAIIFYRSNVKKELAYKEQIKDLNNQIKAKEDSINAYREQVDIFVDKVHRAEMQLEENQTKIKKIYKEYEVHLLSIDMKNNGVITFMQLDRNICDKYKVKKSENLLFDLDINLDLFKEFTNKKNIDNFTYPNVWYPTTNHCIRRDIINEFVDWYYPDCLFFYEKDNPKCGYYHERLFSVFLDYKKIVPSTVKGLCHMNKKSHGQ